MIFSETVADELSDYLLQIKAIKLNPQNPFTWASGARSPIYCDNRITLSFPEIRSFIKKNLASGITKNFGIPDVIAGVATAGIPHGALVADVLGLPFIYVRSAPKAHGLNNLIEGKVEIGQKVVVIEDLVSTGGSSLQAVDALRQQGCIVTGLAAVFTYGFSKAKDAFANAKCPYFTLTNYNNLLRKAVNGNYIKNGDIENLTKWSSDPSNWFKEVQI